jgi:hypothetical protein
MAGSKDPAVFVLGDSLAEITPRLGGQALPWVRRRGFEQNTGRIVAQVLLLRVDGAQRLNRCYQR